MVMKMEKKQNSIKSNDSTSLLRNSSILLHKYRQTILTCKMTQTLLHFLVAIKN